MVMPFGCPSGQLVEKDNSDELVKNLKILFSVIPAKAGIKHLQTATKSLDSGFRRSDDLFASPSILGSAAGNFIDVNNAICKYLRLI
jgi:hypothetical protein